MMVDNDEHYVQYLAVYGVDGAGYNEFYDTKPGKKNRRAGKSHSFTTKTIFC